MLDLTKFAEPSTDDDDDGDGEQLATRRNQRRSDWAKGNNPKAQPSENWDDDFLFGSASVESLPLPPKSSDLKPIDPSASNRKKPGSSQSFRSPNPDQLPSRSSFYHPSSIQPSRYSNPNPNPNPNANATAIANANANANSIHPSLPPSSSSTSSSTTTNTSSSSQSSSSSSSSSSPSPSPSSSSVAARLAASASSVSLIPRSSQPARDPQFHPSRPHPHQIIPTELDSHSILRSNQFDHLNSLTPRKPSSSTTIASHHPRYHSSSPSPSPSIPTTSNHPNRHPHQSYYSSNPLLNSSRSSTLRSRPPLYRPPASAPTSRGQSTDATSSNPRPITDHRRVSPLDPTLLSTTTNSKAFPSNSNSNPHHPSSSSFPRRPSSSHKLISSQDSVPSISDLSSAGLRSPSSSLSMTEDSRGDCCHSAEDDKPFYPHHQSISSPTSNRPSTPSSMLTKRDYHSPLHPSTSSDPILDSDPRQAFDRSHRHPFRPIDHHQFSTPNHPSFDSFATSSTSSTSSSSCSKRQHLSSPDSHFTPIYSLTSMVLSTDYYESNSSDVSLTYPTPLHHPQSIIHPTHLSSSQSQDVRPSGLPPPMRSSSSSSTHSHRFGFDLSGSESYDPATSGTETDGLSDHEDPNSSFSTPAGSISIPSNRPTHAALLSQRSRKQALYSRPAYADPSTGPRLGGSISSSTLNASQTSIYPSTATPSYLPNNNGLSRGSVSDQSSHPNDDERSVKAHSRRRFRKKRPSALPLSNTRPLSSSPSGIESSPPAWSPTSALFRRVTPSELLRSAQSGDLAFAADSDDDERCPRRLSAVKRSVPPNSLKKPSGSQSNLYPQLASSLNSGSNHRGLGLRSRSSITRSQNSNHSRGSTHHYLTQPDSTSNEGSIMRANSKRPLSFTALFSRNSHSTPCPPICDPSPHREVHHSRNLSKSCFGHRYSTSIDSTPNHSASSPQSQTSNDSLLSRVRRLSSRAASSKRSHRTSSPSRKRFSIVADTASRLSALDLGSASSSQIQQVLPKKVAPTANRFSTVLKSNRRQTNQSDSTVHHQILNTLDTHGTVRASRPSSRASCSNAAHHPGRKIQSRLSRKFSLRSNNKADLYQPDLDRSSTERIDHELTSSIQAPSNSVPRRTLPSKPPKSNPALRAKAAASAQLQDYRTRQEFVQHSSSDSRPFELSPTDSSFGSFSPPPLALHHTVRTTSDPAPNSEPLPSAEVSSEHEMQAPNQLHHIGNITGPLTRSNSMGELRIPSRITSQQGRLQTELNQVKEFARGIEELKVMRRTYRKMIRSTHRSTFDRNYTTATDDSDGNSTDSDVQKDPEPLPNREQSDENCLIVDPNQVSPRALERIYSIIQKIQEEYKEWWTCCNVLIDLGEGSTDPRKRFSPEEVRAITSYSSELHEPSKSSDLSSTAMNPHETPEPGSQKHFEILKSMFGPGNGQVGNQSKESSGSQTTPTEGDSDPVPNPANDSKLEDPDRCQTPVIESQDFLECGDKTPISRLTDQPKPSSSRNYPETPTPASRRVLDDGHSTTTTTSSSNSRAPDESSIRLSDWSESEGSWVGSLFCATLPNSTSLKPPGNPSSRFSSLKEKKRPLAGRHSSYHHQLDRLLNPDLNSSRPRLSAGSRIGISGIKDFLRVLKARVNAEERWPTKKIVSNPSISTTGMKKGPVSNMIHAHLKNQPPALEKSAPEGGMKPRSNNQNSDTSTDKICSPSTPIDRAESDQQSTNVDQADSISSEEECWDELFGFKDSTMTTTSGSQGTESLDLALPLHQQKKKSPPGTESRFALSSERMPQLLSYLSIVKEQCKECLVELKSQTV